MTIFQQTGWRRSHPQQICQDIEVLERVTDFTFDATNEDFLDYFTSRTGYAWRKADCGPERMKQIIADQSINDRWLRIMRAKLQDCWELYHRHVLNQPIQSLEEWRATL